MFKAISKFVGSKVSGYLLIGILVALAGAGYWFWSELKEFGGLTEKAAQQADTIEEQEQRLATLARDIAAKEAVLDYQLTRTTKLRQQAEVTRQELKEARDEAPQDYIDARDTVVPERLRFGPSRQARSSED